MSNNLFFPPTSGVVIYPQGTIHLNEWNSGSHLDTTRHVYHRKTRTVFSSDSKWLLSMWHTSQLLQAACNHGSGFQLMILMNSMEEWMCKHCVPKVQCHPREMKPVPPLLLHARGRPKEKAKALLYPPRHVLCRSATQPVLISRWFPSGYCQVGSPSKIDALFH